MTADPGSLHDDKKRSSPRTRLCLSAQIHFDHRSEVVRLRDLSADGVRIEGANLPGTGTSVQIRRGSLLAGGTVMWRDRKGCGLQFDAPLPLDDWVGKRAKSDLAVAAGANASNLEPVPTVTSPASLQALRDALPHRLAEELAFVGRLLKSLGDELSSEPMIVLRHGERLQNIDLSTQILGHVAALLVAKHPEQEVAAIDMVSLRKRLQRVSL
jgi:hypothetical protein